MERVYGQKRSWMAHTKRMVLVRYGGGSNPLVAFSGQGTGSCKARRPETLLGYTGCSMWRVRVLC